MNTQAVFDELRARVRASDVSQNVMANTLGIQQASISKFLARKMGISAETFLQLLLFVGGMVSFDKDAAVNGRCMKELDATRRELAAVRQRVIELEAECRVQERMLERFMAYPQESKKTPA